MFTKQNKFKRKWPTGHNQELSYFEKNGVNSILWTIIFKIQDWKWRFEFSCRTKWRNETNDTGPIPY